MIPDEKALVKRLADKPFALVGVNSDGNAETVNKILDREGITWTNVIDGTTSGPIATQWNVHGWPTIYILDAKGVIRHRGLRGKAMDDAVDKLLAEMEGKR